MGIIGNRGLQGQPVLPYANVKSYAGADVFMDLAFLDHTGTPVVPISITLEIDDLTNDQTPLSPTVLNPAGSSVGPLFYPAFSSAFTIQISGNSNFQALQMSFPYEGSQLDQIVITFTAIDSVTGNLFNAPAVSAVIELCAIQTPSGM
jgi:hypothetical protein